MQIFVQFMLNLFSVKLKYFKKFQDTTEALAGLSHMLLMFTVCMWAA
jgi:hypothetical protein